MIIEVVKRILEADGPIFAALAERIYPVQLPDAPTFPAAVLTKAAGLGEYDMEGDVGVERARVQVDIYHAGGYAACVALKTLVRRRLSGFKGSIDSGLPCQVQAMFCINDFDLTEPATERAGPRLRRRTLEFTIWSQEV